MLSISDPKCNCATSFMSPHRKSKCMLRNMAATTSIDTKEPPIDILFTNILRERLQKFEFENSQYKAHIDVLLIQHDADVNEVHLTRTQCAKTNEMFVAACTDLNMLKEAKAELKTENERLRNEIWVVKSMMTQIQNRFRVYCIIIVVVVVVVFVFDVI